MPIRSVDSDDRGVRRPRRPDATGADRVSNRVDVIALSTRGPELLGHDGISPLAENVLKSSTVPVLLTRGRPSP